MINLILYCISVFVTDLRSYSFSSLLSFTSSAVRVKVPRVREVGGGQMWPLWPYFCSYYGIGICTHLITAHLQKCQERVWQQKTIHISNFQQLSESHTSLFTPVLWAMLQFVSVEDPQSNCRSSQHSRLWHTPTVAYSPEAMLMISLTIASWASSYSSLFLMYSSLMALSLLWTKQESLEAVTFCLHLQCQTFGLLICKSIPGVPTCFNSKDHKATDLLFIQDSLKINSKFKITHNGQTRNSSSNTWLLKTSMFVIEMLCDKD